MCTHTHTHSLSLSLSHTHTHTHTHIQIGRQTNRVLTLKHHKKIRGKNWSVQTEELDAHDSTQWLVKYILSKVDYCRHTPTLLLSSPSEHKHNVSYWLLISFLVISYEIIQTVWYWNCSTTWITYKTKQKSKQTKEATISFSNETGTQDT